LKETLVVFDFDGLLIDSYSLLKNTFKQFGLNIGDQERFKNRRKFLKYIGGGKEFIAITSISLCLKIRSSVKP
jgi:phosphoglycolate phosphatase